MRVVDCTLLSEPGATTWIRAHALPVDASLAHVDPGLKGTIVWTFNPAGSFEFTCLIPGHFEAGMIGRITVK
jgi:uncharacterized cupredoxin-like copper-binding protein